MRRYLSNLVLTLHALHIVHIERGIEESSGSYFRTHSALSKESATLGVNKARHLAAFHDAVALCMCCVSMEPQSYIILLCFALGLWSQPQRGHHRWPQQAASKEYPLPLSWHHFRSHRSGTLSRQAPICYNVNGRKQDILLRSVMNWIVALRSMMSGAPRMLYSLTIIQRVLAWLKESLRDRRCLGHRLVAKIESGNIAAHIEKSKWIRPGQRKFAFV